MRFLLSIILSLCLVQPAMAQSWFQRMFGTSIKQAVFTEEERRLIHDYYFERERQLKQARERERHGDDDRWDDEDKKRKGKIKKGKHGKEKGLPPGLAKKDTLPPGLAKQLEKNGTLPPGLEKRVLPDDLYRKLPRRSKKHDRVIVDRDVVLLERATGKVLDILRDVVVGPDR